MLSPRGRQQNLSPEVHPIDNAEPFFSHMTTLSVVTCVTNVFEVQSAIRPYSPLGEVTQFFLRHLRTVLCDMR